MDKEGLLGHSPTPINRSRFCRVTDSVGIPSSSSQVRVPSVWKDKALMEICKLVNKRWKTIMLGKDHTGKTLSNTVPIVDLTNSAPSPGDLRISPSAARSNFPSESFSSDLDMRSIIAIRANSGDISICAIRDIGSQSLMGTRNAVDCMDLEQWKSILITDGVMVTTEDLIIYQKGTHDINIESDRSFRQAVCDMINQGNTDFEFVVRGRNERKSGK